MREPTPKTIHLKDYTPPAFLVSTVELEIEIRDEDAIVRARLMLNRNPDAAESAAPLVLNGDELELQSIAIDGKKLAADAYSVDSERLTIPAVPDTFKLETVVVIVPQKNTNLEGLYATKAGFVTQCEAQGFRRITWFLDRPDVMAKYTVTVRASKEKYPVLLSNGNLVGSGEQRGGRHWAKFVDPHPKPCYLFAMVAAKLEMLEDAFVTKSGRQARLAIYVEPGKLDQSGFAMQCLKSSMKWDEEVYGLELDLDQYMIVAVGDFNSGAMENKGLNIFNTKYVLARPDVATDIDYQNIDRVVAHEYFHNWTGDRVTCRDWFQLSLKEGLTVFRDQEYGADMYSRPVQRIQEVRGLRSAQFPEDAGPMAHPVRPQSYMEIRNFYTMTVYEKGAEVVRMQHTLLGPDLFRKGMDLYFERHDGQAVTTDDFVAAMQDASGIELTQFKRWYDQAGTPVLDISGEYDEAAKRYTLTVKQSCPPTPGQPEKLPFHIPFAVGLVGPDGTDFASRLVSLKAAEEVIVFEDIPAKPVPSILRGFSAPVIARVPYTEAELAHLMAHDSDAFNRWEAGQRLATGLLLGGTKAAPRSFIDAWARVLKDAAQDPAFASEALGLPSETTLAEQMDVVDPDALHAARNGLRRQLAGALREALLATYRSMTIDAPYSPDSASAGKRSLKNLCLGVLMELDDAEVRALCVKQFETADNMTDAMAALTLLTNTDCPERAPALESFHARWKDEPLVVDKWLAVQATARLPGTLAEVKRLTAHPAFDIKNPNKIYSLIRAFVAANHVRFHAADGGGYAFAADQVIAIDTLNPQVAARVARCFDRWKKFDAGRQAHAKAALERVLGTDGLSRDVAEIVGKALA